MPCKETSFYKFHLSGQACNLQIHLKIVKSSPLLTCQHLGSEFTSFPVEVLPDHKTFNQNIPYPPYFALCNLDVNTMKTQNRTDTLTEYSMDI